jgi:hypothetical protein
MTIDDLLAAFAAVGHTGLERRDAVPWDEIERELGPLSLPADLRRLWERVDVARLPGAPYPRPSPPDFALAGWRMLRDDPSGFPAGLFPWCYESHGHLLIELGGPGAAAGTLFEWAFGDQTIVLRYRDIGDWIAVVVDLLREGSVNDSDRARDLAAARLAAHGPHPVYGTGTEFGLDPGEWPAHWGPISDIAHSDPPARSPERTIAEVHAARRNGPVTATVTGVAHYHGGGAGEGRRIMLWDGTGHLDVWCPPDVRGLGLLAGRPPFRIEIEAGHWTAARPRPDLWPFGHPVPPGALPATRAALLEHLPTQATATIVHRT